MSLHSSQIAKSGFRATNTLSIRRLAVVVRAFLTACVACLPLALGACRTAEAGSDVAAKAMIDNVLDRYAKAYQHNDPDAIAKLYAEEAVLMPPGHELVEGRDSVRAFWGRGMEPGFRMTTMRVEVSGSTAYVVGRYYVPPDDDDDAETGKYLIALRKEPDGNWRITADIWNDDESDEEPDSTSDTTRQSVALL
jgi:uncharacterized protein (TIGR02246 family)